MYSIFEEKCILGVLVVIALSGRITETVFIVMGVFISIVFFFPSFVFEYSVVCHCVRIGIASSLIWPDFNITGFGAVLFN